MQMAGRIAAYGVAGALAFTVLNALLIPILGMLLGLLMTAVKISIVVGIVVFFLNFFKKRRDQDDSA